jgi:hypothetical protein
MQAIPKFGPGTKRNEYIRSIELFEQVMKEKGTYFALALLYDMQYSREDVGEMMKIIKPNTPLKFIN